MRLTWMVALALLGGCKREPDFSERYEAASRQIGTAARQIDELRGELSAQVQA